MKNVLIATLYFCFITTIFSQGQNCGNTIPIPVCPDDTVVCHTQLTDSFKISTPSNLPDVEWGIVDLNKMATNGSGPAIVGVDEDGIFIPEEYGIDTATTIEVIPIAYDILAIQETLDDILLGTIPPFSIPCCTVAPDVCTQLMNAGINSGSDFMSLSQAFALVSSDTSDLLSVQDFINGLDSVNMSLSDPLIPAACGGGDMICYAYGEACTLGVKVIEPFLSLSAPLHDTDSTFTAEIIQSTATVQNGLFINYLFDREASLGTDFTVEINGELLIDSQGCD